MRIDRNQIVEVILNALHNLNKELDESDRFEVQDNMVLLGPGAALDSQGLVSLVMEVELTLDEGHGFDVNLVDERAMSMKHSPFQTVQTLADYIYGLVAK